MLYYAGMILWFIAGNLFSDSQGDSKATPTVSVIIAIRDGEKSHSPIYLQTYLLRIIQVK